MGQPFSRHWRLYNNVDDCSSRGVSKTLLNIYDEAFLRKQLTAFSRSLFPQEKSIVSLGSNYTSALLSFVDCERILKRLEFFFFFFWINLFQIIGLFLYPLKTSENLWCSDLFGGEFNLFGVITARFLNYVWSFYNIMHEKVKSWQSHNPNSYYYFLSGLTQ